MLYSYILLVLIIQAECEWVEITQQLYKKPMRPTHNHPLLTVGKASETTRPTHLQTAVASDDAIRKTHNRPLIDTTGKVNDDDRVNKRNRIYINHTLVGNSWDIDSVHDVPGKVNVKLKSDTEVNKTHNIIRNPTVSDVIVAHETKSNGEIIIKRRPKPESTKNVAARTDKPLLHRTTIAGHIVRVRPLHNKRVTNKPMPIDEDKEAIEVLNLSDLEYTTAEDILNTNLDKGIENTVKLKESTSNERRKLESSKTDISYVDRNSNPIYNSTAKQPPAFTNMRRVEIIRSTKPTLIEDFDELDHRTNKPSSSPKPQPITERTTSRRQNTTIYKFPNIGHVKRVHVETNPTKTQKSKPENKYASTELPEDNFTRKRDEVENKLRVDISTSRLTTTEKSFPVRTKPGELAFENNIKLNQVPTVPNPEDVMLEELIIGEEKHFDVKVHKIASIGTVKRVSNPTTATTLNKKKIDKVHSIKQYSDSIPEIETDEEITVADEDSDINYNNISKNHYFTSSTEEIPTPTTAKLKLKQSTVTRRPEIIPQIEKYDSNPYKPVGIHEHIPKFVTKEDKYGKIEFESTSKNNVETTMAKEESNNEAKRPVTEHNLAREPISGTQSYKNADDPNETDDPLSNNRKNSAMENLIKFLKTVTEIITKNTRRGIHGKLRYLEDLRDTIMANIEERLEAEFPDDDSPGNPGSRRARSAEPRGHVEFPSSEGALMTISFLTFAVFLIKLVLQVIQAYKNKTMMMMPTVVAAVGRAYSERGNRG